MHALSSKRIYMHMEVSYTYSLLISSKFSCFLLEKREEEEKENFWQVTRYTNCKRTSKGVQPWCYLTRKNINCFSGHLQHSFLWVILHGLAQEPRTLNFQQQCSLHLQRLPRQWLKVLNHHRPENQPEKKIFTYMFHSRVFQKNITIILNLTNLDLYMQVLGVCGREKDHFFVYFFIS